MQMAILEKSRHPNVVLMIGACLDKVAASFDLHAGSQAAMAGARAVSGKAPTPRTAAVHAAPLQLGH